METTLSFSTPPQPSANNLQRNVQDRARFAMPLIDQNLRRIAYPFQSRFNHNPNPISLNTHIITSIRPKFMADESPKKTENLPIKAETTGEGKIKDEEKEGSENPTAKPIPSPPPTPPEKPLPGDCCGSGCVRCVWDVYYEELEEYDKHYKAN